MPVGDVSIPNPVYAIDGVRLGATQAGVRYQNRHDLLVIELADGAKTSVVTTKNAFCAAPVHIVRQHIMHSTPRYLLINTGNANAATGHDGHQRAMSTCDALAEKTKTEVASILPYSTGVIGEPLNAQAIIAGLDDALQNLDANGWQQAAHTIRTTDTIDKLASESIEVDGVTYHTTGMSKGAGMIRPNMATMLAFVATDANIAKPLLDDILTQLVDATFNRITVDGDTSTNDCCTLMATGDIGQHENLDSENSAVHQAQSRPLIDSREHPHFAPVFAMLQSVFHRLATLIVRDGEGATKFITVKVTGGKTTQECCDVAYAVAHSPLVKTAFFASDPNWGRLLAAIGYAGLSDLDTTKVSVHLDEVAICTRGQRDPNYTEQAGQTVMTRPEITVHIELGRGQASDTVYTCDLSHEYVSINADYRS